MKSSSNWQGPYYNILSHYPLQKWKKCFKGGGLSTEMDKELKATVYHISGSIPAANFVQLTSASSSQSNINATGDLSSNSTAHASHLQLTGHLLYLLFKPVPGKSFVFHVDTLCSDGQSVRISISNLYRECKNVSVNHLQFPYVCLGAFSDQPPSDEDAPTRSYISTVTLDSASSALKTQWTVLCIDLAEILQQFCNTSSQRRFVCVRGIQLCANMLVKNLFTSDQRYHPEMSLQLAKTQRVQQQATLNQEMFQHCLPLPKEMSFPLSNGVPFSAQYDFVTFPEWRINHVSRNPPTHPKPSSATTPGLNSSTVKPTLSLRRPEHPYRSAKKRATTMMKQSHNVKSDQTKVRISSPEEITNGAPPAPLPSPEVASVPSPPSTHLLKRLTISDDENDEYLNGNTEEARIKLMEKPENIKPSLKEVTEDIFTTPQIRVVREETTGETSKRLPAQLTQPDIFSMTDPFPPNLRHIAADNASSVDMVLLEDGNILETTKMGTLGGEKNQSLQPDPVMRLDRVMGCQVPCKQLLWSVDNKEVIYISHTLVIAMAIQGRMRAQRFFTGHRAPVSCIALTQNGRWLASGEGGEQAMIRIWKFATAQCLAVFKAAPSTYALSQLKFAPSSRFLVAVGCDLPTHKKCLAVWDVHSVDSQTRVNAAASGVDSPLVTYLTKSSTDVDIQCICFHDADEHRLISCGRNNIRLWRLKHDQLRGTQVNLGDFAASTNPTGSSPLSLTAIWLWRPLLSQGASAESDGGECREWSGEDRLAFVCSLSGHVFEVDVQRFTLHHVRRLLPTRAALQTGKMRNPEGVPLTCLAMNESFVVTGSEDCYVRLWPHDFSHVYLEAQYDCGVETVQLSQDGLLILVGLSNGQMGYLDIAQRSHTCLMSSHVVSPLCSVDVDPLRHHIATAGADGSIRVWHVDTLEQLVNMHCPSLGRECPIMLAYRPSALSEAKRYLLSATAPTEDGTGVLTESSATMVVSLAVGFDSGVVRVYDVDRCVQLAECRELSSAVTGLAFSACGRFLYVCDSRGTLVVLNCANHTYRVVRRLSHAVVTPQGSVTARRPTLLAADPDQVSLRVAVIGPTEFAVTCFDGQCLDEVLRADLSLCCDTQGTSSAGRKTSSSRSAWSSTRSTGAPNSGNQLDALLHIYFTRATFNHILVCTQSSRLLLVDKVTGALLLDFGGLRQHQANPGSLDAPVTALAISPDSRFIVTATGGPRGVLRVWDGELRSHWMSQQFISYFGSGAVSRVVFSPDQRYLVIVGEGNQVLLWRFLGRPIAPTNSNSVASTPRSTLPVAESKDDQQQTIQSSTAVKSNPLLQITDNRLEEKGPSTTTVSAGKEDEVVSLGPHPCPLSYRHLTLPSGVTHVTPQGGELSGMDSLANTSVHFHGTLGCSGERTGTTKALYWDASRGVFIFAHGRLLVMENLDSGQQLLFPDVHSAPITCIAVSPNGEQMLSCSHASPQPLTSTLPQETEENSSVKRHLPMCELLVWDLSDLERLGPNLRQRLHQSSPTMAGGIRSNSTSSLSETGSTGASGSTTSWSHHTTAVVSADFSGQGEWCVTLGDYRQNLVCLWHVGQGKAASWELAVCSAVRSPSHQVLWLPPMSDLMGRQQSSELRFLTCGSGQSRLVFWMVQSSRATHPPQDSLRQSVSPTGSALVEATSLQVYEAEIPAAIVAQQPSTLEFSCVTCWISSTTSSLSHSGWSRRRQSKTLLFLGSTTGRVCVFDVSTMRFVMHWEADSAEVGYIFASGDKLVTGSRGGHLTLWNIAALQATGKQVASSSVRGLTSVHSVVLEHRVPLHAPICEGAFDQLVEMGVVATSAGVLWYINWSEAAAGDNPEVESQEVSHTKLVDGPARAVTGLVWSGAPEANLLLTACEDGSVQLWNWKLREEHSKLQVRGSECLALEQWRHLCLAGYSDGHVRLFDVAKVSLVLKAQPHPQDAITCVACLFLGSDQRFDNEDEEEAENDVETETTESLRRHLFLLSGSVRGRIVLSSAWNGALVRTVSEHDGAPIQSLHTQEVSGLWLASSADRRISIWRVAPPAVLTESIKVSKQLEVQLIDWITFAAPPLVTPLSPQQQPGKSPPRQLLTHWSQQPPTLALFVPGEVALRIPQSQGRGYSSERSEHGSTVIYTGYGSQQPQLYVYSVASRSVILTIALSHWVLSWDLALLHVQGHYDLLLALGDEARGLTLKRLFLAGEKRMSHHRGAVQKVRFSSSAANPRHLQLASASDSEVLLWTVAVETGTRR